MNIPLEELPGCARQDDGPHHLFTVLSAEQLYANSPEVLNPLRALGFDFSPSSSQNIVWKTKNPEAKLAVDTIEQLLRIVDQYGNGNVIITKDRKLVLSSFLSIPYTEPAKPDSYPGYTSVGHSK